MGNCNLDCFTPNSPQIQFEKGGKVIKFDLSQDGAESTETILEGRQFIITQ